MMDRPEHYSEHQDVLDMLTDVIDDIGMDACFTNMETIEHNHVSGFIPFTDGGWNGVITFDLVSEQAEHNSIIAPYNDADYKRMVESFCDEHGVSTEFDYWDHAEWEQFRDDWQYNTDPTNWFVYARAIFYESRNSRNETGEDEFHFLVGVNTDFNYGRDYVSYAKGAQTYWVYERTVPVSLITKEVLSTVRDEMIEAWYKS